MEVLYEDYLERLVVTGNKKEYKKSYFVFRQDTAGSKTLEYFKDTNWRKNEPRGVCNLFNGYSVRVLGFNETKKKFGMELKTVGKIFELHAGSEQLRDKWIEVLNRDLENFHNAKVLECPPNAYPFVKGLSGQLHIQITDCSVVLLSNRVPSITWRFGTIRRYKSKDGAFVLEVGRKSTTGEGIFRFQVPNPNKLFDDLDKALKQRILLKRNQDSSIDASRASSFDESSHRRSMNIRSPSMEERPLPPNPPGYSTLGNIPTHNSVPEATEVNGYDKLFGTTPPSQPQGHLFQNTTIIGGKTNSNEDSPDENYIDMSGMKAEIINECRNTHDTRPRPAPRPQSNVSSEISRSSSPAGLEIQSRIGPVNNAEVDLIDLIDLNTYDCPSTLDLSASPYDESLSDYHKLNKHTPPKSYDSAVGYDHLSHMYSKNDTVPNSSEGTTENVYGNTIEEVYDAPKLHPSDKKMNDSLPLKSTADPSRKPPPPPIPTRPQPPARRPRRGSDRVNSCDSFHDTVLVLGKSPTQMNAVSQPRETLYDSPRCNLTNEFENSRRSQSLNAEAFHHMNASLNDMYQVPRSDGS